MYPHPYVTHTDRDNYDVDFASIYNSGTTESINWLTDIKEINKTGSHLDQYGARLPAFWHAGNTYQFVSINMDRNSTGDMYDIDA